MKSRERLLNCIKHKPIDKVPISTYEMVPHYKDDFYHKAPSYAKMIQFFKENTDCVYSTAAMPIGKNPLLEVISEPIKGGTLTKQILHTRQRDLVKIQKRYDNQHTNWTIKHFCDDLLDLRAYIDVLPDITLPVTTKHAHELEKKLGDDGVIMLSMADPLCVIADSFEFGQFMVYAMTETKEILKATEAIFEHQKIQFDQTIKGGVSDMMVRIYGPEYATPPYLPPRLFPELVTNYLKYYCSEIKQAGGFPRIHCHGNIKDALHEFLKTDMMILEPIEPIPDGDISLRDVKDICENKVCLMGNIELKDLENQSKKYINNLVKNIMADAKGDSGFIIMPTASPINEPLAKKTEENYFEFINASLEYGKY